MKRILSMILAFFFTASLLTGCGAGQSVSVNAEIYEISGDRLTVVAIDENSQEAMGDDYFFVGCGSARIKNSVGRITAADLNVGDTVEVFWDGMIFRSYPEQIEAETITVTSEEPRELFLNDDGSIRTRAFTQYGYPKTSDLDADSYETATLKPLEIICNFLESDTATAELTSIVCRDNRITGEITITDNTPYEYDEGHDFTKNMMQLMDDTYVITWHCGDADEAIGASGGGLSLTDAGTPAVYTRRISQYLKPEEEDRTVEISITGFDGSLSFTIPGEK